MREELELLQLHYAGELYYDLLGVLTELGTLPPPGVGSGVQKLGHRILRLLTTAVDYSVLQFNYR